MRRVNKEDAYLEQEDWGMKDIERKCLQAWGKRIQMKNERHPYRKGMQKVSVSGSRCNLFREDNDFY